MAFTRQMCEETGSWAGRCGHTPVVVTKGERFPECPGCRRGIAWNLVVDAGGAGRKGAARTSTSQAYADSADVGWWPGKEAETVSGE